jgi:nucleoside-diphosphate-sugar epimerase
MNGSGQHPERKTRIACVTGATGMIGSRIARHLADRGFSVRVLARRGCNLPNVEVFQAGLADEQQLDQFLSCAEMVFHCAAELNDEATMHETNVGGTRRLIELARRHKVRYFCHLSSAGVVGKVDQITVNETTLCQPQNAYEKSKWEAEKLFEKGIAGCKVVILRPTNVVDCQHPGELAIVVDGSISSIVKAILKGGECAHLVHAEDVASAALHFIDLPIASSPRTYFISRDADPENSISHVWRMYREMLPDKAGRLPRRLPHLPISIPYALRRIARRPSNRGDVTYSSARIESEGFRFAYGVERIVRGIAFGDDAPASHPNAVITESWKMSRNDADESSVGSAATDHKY